MADLVAGAVERRESMRREQVASERRSRRRYTIVAVAAVGVGMLGPAIGAANPWNLLVVDQVLDHPSVGAFVALAGVVGLLSIHVQRPQVVRIGGFVVCGLAAVAVVVAAAVLALGRPNIVTTAKEASSFNDVEVRVTKARYAGGGPEIWQIWLSADRGLASREHAVAVLQFGDRSQRQFEPVPIAVLAELPAADRLEVTVDGQVAYRLDFDPDDLKAIREDCTPVSSPAWGDAAVRCVDDLSEWQY